MGDLLRIIYGLSHPPLGLGPVLDEHTSPDYPHLCWWVLAHVDADEHKSVCMMLVEVMNVEPLGPVFTRSLAPVP